MGYAVAAISVIDASVHAHWPLSWVFSAALLKYPLVTHQLYDHFISLFDRRGEPPTFKVAEFSSVPFASSVFIHNPLSLFRQLSQFRVLLVGSVLSEVVMAVLVITVGKGGLWEVAKRAYLSKIDLPQC